jgi:7 transmembrane receptor (rhodopsin family)
VNIFAYAANAAIFCVYLNIQLAMSADRVLVICFPMTYYKYKDMEYSKWVVQLCFAFGIIFGSVYLFVELSNKTAINSFDPEVDMNYKTFIAIWATIVTAFIVAFNISVIYSTLRRVRRTISEEKKILKYFFSGQKSSSLVGTYFTGSRIVAIQTGMTHNNYRDADHFKFLPLLHSETFASWRSNADQRQRISHQVFRAILR